MDEVPVMHQNPVSRRLVMAGWAGIGAAALVGAKLASAQESTPSTDGNTESNAAADFEAQAAALYEVFLTSVATSIGATDNASVDLAIRDGLKTVVDQRLADGDISADSATEKKAAIDEATVPISFLSRRNARNDRGGRFGRSGGGPDGGMGGNVAPDSDDGEMTTDDPAAESTPSV